MDSGPFTTDVPARLDRLRWSRFHTLLIAALGTSWIIDGLEVTLVGSLASVLMLPTGLGLSSAQVGEAAAAYVAGAVIGAILFGGLADRHGRRKLFFAALGLYATATVASGFAPDFFTFAALRFLTGAGIGGEYAAINSAIQEFMPARLRGRIDLAVNGSFWIGAAAGAAGAVIVLDSGLFSPEWGWRAAFIIGGALGFEFSSFGVSCPKARGGCCCIAARRRPKRSLPPSRPRRDNRWRGHPHQPSCSIRKEMSAGFSFSGC